MSNSEIYIFYENTNILAIMRDNIFLSSYPVDKKTKKYMNSCVQYV